MCGIAGWIDFKEAVREDPGSITRMSEALFHRGPDEHGEAFFPSAALLHRRLTVVDAEGGKQPMGRTVGGTEYVICYNGELYNTEELRRDLLDEGFTFQGYSDTEVLLNAYICWGAGCLEKLNGIYAFGVWNVQEESLFLARDKAGVKPLFIYPYGHGLLFASEIKSLLAHTYVKPEVDREGIAEIFLLGPGRTPGQGVFKGIEEILPGHYATFSRKGLHSKPYFTLEAHEHPDSFETTVEKVRFLVTDAIERQMVSDVPLCTFLSGGLDSSIITHIASESYRTRGEKLQTYSVDYQDNNLYFQANAFQPNSDGYYIDLMTEHSGTEHENVVLETGDLFNALRPAMSARDLPGMADVDSSLLLFAGEVKKKYTVALSGECADEIFGGYPWYHNPEVIHRDGFPWSTSTALRAGLLRPGILGQIEPEDYVLSRYFDTVNRTPRLPGDTPENARMREMFLLNIHWFMQTLLDRKDRMTMHQALEVRVPFCDYRIMEYLFNVPVEMRHYKGREKGLLRKAMEGILPQEIIYRKKSPYPKTFHPAYLALLQKELGSILTRKNSPLLQIGDKERLTQLAESGGKSFTLPWYGQLMTGPQVIAYMIQINAWMEEYKVEIQ